MKRLLALCRLSLVVAILGCGTPTVRLEGAWTGTAILADKALRQHAGLAPPPFTLTFKPEHRFSMSQGDVPIDGTYEQQGGSIILRLEHIQGQTTAEIRDRARMSPRDPEDRVAKMLRPIKLDIESDGTLSLPSPTEGDSSKVVFKKNAS